MNSHVTPGLGGAICQSFTRALVIMTTLAGCGVTAPAQTVIFGPTARAQFDANVATYGDTWLNFDSLTSNSPLSTQLQVSHGLTFSSIIQTNGSPIVPPHNARVSSVNVGGNTTNKLVGTPFALSGGDDGRVGYAIAFGAPQARAGIERIWQAGNSLTRFYNSTGTLLATHANTVNIEFVAYMANYDDPTTWVSRIELDGLSQLGTRQVGYSDHLIYGFVAVPEPTIPGLLMAGLGVCWFARRRGKR